MIMCKVSLSEASVLLFSKTLETLKFVSDIYIC